MDKICGYKSKDGNLYSSEEDCKLADHRYEADKVAGELRMLVNRTILHNGHYLDSCFLTRNIQVAREMRNMLDKYISLFPEEVEHVEEVAKPKSIGFWKGLFK